MARPSKSELAMMKKWYVAIKMAYRGAWDTAIPENVVSAIELHLKWLDPHFGYRITSTAVIDAQKIVRKWVMQGT